MSPPQPHDWPANRVELWLTSCLHANAEVLGEERAVYFFERFLDEFFTEEDAAFIASLGLNLVRIPVHYRHFEDDMAPFQLKEEGFARLDRAVDACARHGLYTIIDLHVLPGSQNQEWHSDNLTHKAAFWQHRHFQERVLHLWQALADRYKSNPWVAGYDPMNEPGDLTGVAVARFFPELTQTIREVDPDHILFLKGNAYGEEFGYLKEQLPNIVFIAFDWGEPGSALGGPYPGETRGTYYDRTVLEQTILDLTAHARATGTPLWVSEFGPIYPGDPEVDEYRYRVLADQLDIFRTLRANWAIWTYKDIGVHGLVYAAPDSSWVTRIQPVLEKKRRLAVDLFGSVDDEIRDIMEPLEVRFAREFPTFGSRPPTREWWLARLVRNILLAEPMAAEFAACFEGMTESDIDELMTSFRLDRCVRRDRLLDFIRKETGAEGVQTSPVVDQAPS